MDRVPNGTPSVFDWAMSDPGSCIIDESFTVVAATGHLLTNTNRLTGLPRFLGPLP